MLIKPSGLVHANRWGPGGTVMLSVVLSDHLEDYAASYSGGWLWMKGRAAARATLSFAHRVAEGDHIAVEESIIDLLSTGFHLPKVRKRRPPWLRRVRDVLHAAHDPISISALAKAEDLHPVYLSRRFHQEFGETIGAYARRLRIQEAARLIGEGGAPLTDVAHEMRFSDQGHLSRSVRREFGVTPSSYRRLVSALPP